MSAMPVNEALEQALERLCAEAGGPLGEVCQHALAGGGRMRAALLLRASGRTDPQAIAAAAALELMHAATLLQDDIFDRSAERRGRRAAYLQFGEAQAVLASDWLLLRSLELAADLDAAYFQQLSRAARTMAATVAAELDPPPLSGLRAAGSYIEQICQGKTASLFAVAFFGAALLHPGFGRAHAAAWAETGRHIGLTYQLLDDCLDVYAPAGTLNKSSGVDLERGRLTLPLLTAFSSLQAAGQHFDTERFRKGSLSEEQFALARAAVMNPSVRSCLQVHVATEMRAVEQSARRAAVPDEAVAAALADMQLKVRLCFGMGASAEQNQPEQVHAV